MSILDDLRARSPAPPALHVLSPAHGPEERWFVEHSLLVGILAAGWARWPTPLRSFLKSDEGVAMFAAPEQVPGWTCRERAYELDRAVGQVFDAVDLWRDVHTLPPKTPVATPAMSLLNSVRVQTWRALLDMQDVSPHHAESTWLQVIAQAPQEALIPGEKPNPAWSLDRGVYWVQEWWPRILRAVPQHTTVHKTETPGPNDACPCKSGKKYKKCCGVAGRAT